MTLNEGHCTLVKLYTLNSTASDNKKKLLLFDKSLIYYLLFP